MSVGEPPDLPSPSQSQHEDSDAASLLSANSTTSSNDNMAPADNRNNLKNDNVVEDKTVQANKTPASANSDRGNHVTLTRKELPHGIFHKFLRVLYAVSLLVFVSLDALCCYLLQLFSSFYCTQTKQEVALIVTKFFFGLSFIFAPWIRVKPGPGTASTFAQMVKAAEKEQAPLFILANHTSFLDTLLTVYAMPWPLMRRVRTYMGVHLFKLPLLSTITKTIGHFPVYFSSSAYGDFKVDREKMAEVDQRVDAHLKDLKRGGVLAFFPEGQLNSNPDVLNEFRRGSFVKALSCDARLWVMVFVRNAESWPVKAQIGGWPAKIRYEARAYAPEGSRAKVAELRQKDPHSELEDAALLAADCRQWMQDLYDETQQDKKSRSGNTKPDMPFLEFFLDAALFITFPAIVYSLRQSLRSVVEFFAFILLTVVAIQLSKKVFGVIATVISTKEAAKKSRNLRKFKDQSWQLVVHVLMTAMELALLSEVDWKWLKDPPSCFDPVTREIPLLRRLYLAQLAIWFVTAFSHRFFEAHHKDYFVMYGHHVTTILLVAGSFVDRLSPIGVLILLAHDSSDIIVDLLKMSNYMGLNEESGLYMVEVMFVANLISWGYCRLYYFTFVLVPTCWFYPDEACAAVGFTSQCKVAKVLIGILVCMHFWWYFLFLRIAVRLLKSAKTQDAGAQEYEGTSESDVDAKRD